MLLNIMGRNRNEREGLILLRRGEDKLRLSLLIVDEGEGGGSGGVAAAFVFNKRRCTGIPPFKKTAFVLSCFD